MEYKEVEMDVWIDHGYESEFFNQLIDEDIKTVVMDEISRDEIGKRFSVTFREFTAFNLGPYYSAEHYQLKDIWFSKPVIIVEGNSGGQVI